MDNSLPRNELEKPADSLWQRMMQFWRRRSSESLRDNLEDALEEHHTSQAFSHEERVMLRNVLQLRELKVEDVMVPRADIIAVSNAIPLGELLQFFRTQNHSRLPVFEESLDNPQGMVHIRDFLDHLVSQAESGRIKKARAKQALDLGALKLDQSLVEAKIIRPVLYVPPVMQAVDLLVKMQSTRTHMALVIDEYGGTEGLVSIEDLVEMIVGDIEDEHDEEGALLVMRTADGAYLINARAHLDELEHSLGLDFEEEDEAEDVDTIGGLIVARLGRVPVRGELIPVGHLEFEVLEADARRIKRLRVRTGQSAAKKAEIQISSVALQNQKESQS